MGEIVTLEFDVLEFEGEAREKLDRLLKELASLLRDMLETAERFRLSTSDGERDLAHDENVSLRQKYAARLQDCEDVKGQIEFLERVFSEANRNRNLLLARGTEGTTGLLLAVETSPFRAVMIDVERRNSRLFGKNYRLMEGHSRRIKIASGNRG